MDRINLNRLIDDERELIKRINGASRIRSIFTNKLQGSRFSSGSNFEKGRREGGDAGMDNQSSGAGQNSSTTRDSGQGERDSRNELGKPLFRKISA